MGTRACLRAAVAGAVVVWGAGFVAAGAPQPPSQAGEQAGGGAPVSAPVSPAQPADRGRVKPFPRDESSPQAWNAADAPWQAGGKPIDQEFTEKQLAALSEEMDLSTLDFAQYRLAVSTAMSALRQVYGRMSPQDEQRLEAKWGPILDYPTREGLAYFNKLNPLLGEFVRLRAGVLALVANFDDVWQEAGLAAGYENATAAVEAVESATAIARALAGLRAQMAEVTRKIEAMGDPPSPYAMRQRRVKALVSAIKLVTVRITPSRQAKGPGEACSFTPIVRNLPAKASLAWEFGDGKAETRWTAQAVSHAYQKEGDYTAKLVVTDAGTSRRLGQAQALVKIVKPPAPATGAAPCYVLTLSRLTLSNPQDWKAAPGGDAAEEQTVFHDPNKPQIVTGRVTAVYRWQHPPGRLDLGAMDRVQCRTSMSIRDAEGKWTAGPKTVQYNLFFFKSDEGSLIEKILAGRKNTDDISVTQMLGRPFCSFACDKYHSLDDWVNQDTHAKVLPFERVWTGPKPGKSGALELSESSGSWMKKKLDPLKYPLAVLMADFKGMVGGGYACYVYAYDPSGQRQPIDPSAAQKGKPGTGAEPEPLENTDWKTVRIEEIQRNISFIRGSLERWREEAARETNAARRTELRNRIVDALTEVSREEDLIASLVTGTIVHRRAAADDVQFHQLIQSCYEDVARWRQAMDSARRAGEIEKHFRRAGEQLRGLIDLLSPDEQKTMHEWADRHLKAGQPTPQEVQKLQKVTQAVLHKVQGKTLGEEAQAQQVINQLEEIKFASGVVLMAASPFAVAQGLVTGSAYLTHAPGVISFSYGCGTGYIEGGPKQAVITGLRFYSVAVDVAVSAVEGFQAENGGLTGAAKQVAFTLLLRKGSELAAGRIIQGRLQPPGRPSLSRQSWQQFVKDARFQQDRAHGENLVRNGRQAVQAFDQMVQRTRPAGQTVEQYLAANAQTLARTPEGRALTEAMSQVECSYHAKMAFRAEDIPPAARASYNRNLEALLQRPVVARTRQLMREMGWNDFEIGQFRHSGNCNRVGFDKDLGVNEMGGWRPMLKGQERTLAEFQRDLNGCLDRSFREHTGGRTAKSADWKGTTIVDEESYVDLAALQMRQLREQGIDPLTRLNPLLAERTAGVNVLKVQKALAKGTVEGKAEAFRTLTKELDTKIIDNLPPDSGLRRYFQRIRDICNRGSETPTSAEIELYHRTGKTVPELAQTIRDNLVGMIQDAHGQP